MQNSTQMRAADWIAKRAIYLDTETTGFDAHCAMSLYAEHYGEWDGRRNSFRWQRLANAARQCRLDIPMNLHRASADAELTRRLVHNMAGGQ